MNDDCLSAVTDCSVWWTDALFTDVLVSAKTGDSMSSALARSFGGGLFFLTGLLGRSAFWPEDVVAPEEVVALEDDVAPEDAVGLFLERSTSPFFAFNADEIVGSSTKDGLRFALKETLLGFAVGVVFK